MMKNRMILCLAVAAGLAACSKAPEKAAETMIESALQKDGTKAKVDLSAGSTRITTTDASGKTTQMEMGGAKVGETELGVPFYPGTKPGEGESSKVSTPDGSMYTVVLHSADPADKVAAFYRERLKSLSTGKQFMEMSGGDGGANLVLADDQAKTTVQVNVMKADKGTDIQIVASRPAGK
ncbi:MAG: hypothetical protein EPN19_15735 [Betaproteobacteria bacterium]|nr:MAG: hypothetical protein EPN19_15735 [Betaproteobacteria bacterium]